MYDYNETERGALYPERSVSPQGIARGIINYAEGNSTSAGRLLGVSRGIVTHWRTGGLVLPKYHRALATAWLRYLGSWARDMVTSYMAWAERNAVETNTLVGLLLDAAAKGAGCQRCICSRAPAGDCADFLITRDCAYGKEYPTCVEGIPERYDPKGAPIFLHPCLLEYAARKEG